MCREQFPPPVVWAPARAVCWRWRSRAPRLDKLLWTEIAKPTGANSNTTALVGTPEQVAEVFGDYYDLGVSHFLIRGFDPLIDAIEYGRELIPLTHKLIGWQGSCVISRWR
jgi:alkanesulfonate monooxygenase SsuD/methylene tetrahydromethanopterin reductase-like flavin-dependent oxidoreductase (luciferase family)